MESLPSAVIVSLIMDKVCEAIKTGAKEYGTTFTELDVMQLFSLELDELRKKMKIVLKKED